MLLGASTLLEPFRHALAYLFLTDELTAISLLNASFYFVEQIETVQRIFDAGIFGKILNCFQDLLLRLNGRVSSHFVSSHRT